MLSMCNTRTPRPPLNPPDELNISASKLALEQPDEPKGSNAEETTLEKDSAAVSSSDAPTPAALKVPASKDPVPVLITLLQQQSALNNTMPEASKSRSSSDDKLIDLYIPAMLDLLRRYAAGESPGHADKLNDAGTGMTQNTRSEIVPAQDGEKAVPSRSCVIEQVQVVRRESARKAVSAAEGPDELVQPTKPSTNTTLVSMPTITRLESFDTQQNPVNVTSPEKEMEYVDTVAPLETTTHTSSTRVAMAHSAEQTHSAEASSRQSGFADVATTSAPLSDHVGQIPEPEQRQADVRPLAPAIGDSKSEIVSDHNLVYPSCQTSLSGSLSTAVQESSNAAPASTQMISARNPLAADATDHQVDTAISQGHDDEAGVAAASLVPEAEVTTAITTTMTAPTVVPETHPNQVLPSQAVVCAPEVKPTQVIVVAQQQHATRAPSGKGTSWTPSDLASAPAAGSEAGLHQLPESASPSAHKIDEPSLKTMSEPEPVIATEQELSKRADQLDRSENAPPSSVADDSDTCPSPEASAPAPEKVPGESSDQAAVSVAVKRVSRTTVPGPFSSGRASIHLIEEGSSSMALDCGAAKNDSASAAAANDSKAPLTSRVRSTEKADSASLAEHGLNHVAIENGIHDAHIETNDQGPAQTKDEESRTLSQCPLNSSQYKPSSSSSSSASPSKQMTSHSVVPGGSDDVHISPTPAPSLSSPCQVVNSTPSIITTDSRTNIQNKHQHPHCITKEASASNIAGAEAALTARTAAAHTKHDPPSTNKDTAAPVSVQSARALSDSSIPIKDHVSQERDTDVADLSVGGTRQRAGTGTGAGVATATATGAEVVATTSAASPQVTEEDGHTVRLEKGDAKLLTHSEAEAMVAAALEAYRRKSAQGLLPVHTMSGDNHSTSTTTAAAAAASTGREPEQAYGVAYVTSHTHTYHARRESGSSGISTLTERRVTSSLLDTQPVNSAIALITQTMIGNYMWKYTRKAVGQGLSERRHQRFFWIHPYTRTLYWSVDAPGTRGREAKAKSALIENVAVIPTPHPDHLPLSSLLIKTTGRPIKITAPDSATHDVWLEALLYLLERSDNDTALGRIDMAESLSSSAISSLRRPQQLRNVRSTSSFAGSMARRRAAARNFKS
ncbi:meiotic cell cortex C-terminal pleckstrin homology-domain-containing protein [Dichotomocladium elegans]|nr:meiotic cell cortex C-terminal pleckstrin homology-domain-containing protein [Dichotomocladium elegans]